MSNSELSSAGSAATVQSNNCRTKKQELRKWQFRIFALTWLAYAAFYFPRTAFSSAKIGILDEGTATQEWLGILDAAYLAAYAVGQFVWGACAERWGTRVVVAGGMVMATAAAFFMGIGAAIWLFLPLMIVQGLSQATGWAPLSKNIASFFTIKMRGRAMGFFSTSYAFGGLAAGPFTGWVAYGLFDNWRYAFLAGASVMLLALVLFLIFQRNSPKEVGLPAIDEDPALFDADHENVGRGPARSKESTVERPKMRFSDLLAAARHDTMVLRLGLVYFLIKPARYAVLLWGPVLVIQAIPDITALTAVLVPISFGIAGVLAPIAFGWISDTVFGGRRVPPSVFSLAGLVLVLSLWQPVAGTDSIVLVTILLGAIGLFAYGADSMVSGVAAVDFGTSKHAGGSAGFINGCGSIGAILGGLLPGFFGPASIFYGFAGAALVAGLILMPCWNRRPVSA